MFSQNQKYKDGKPVRRKVVEPRPPLIPLDQPGRLRKANLMAHLGIAYSTVDARLRKKLIPPADGNDGRPYWNTETIRKFLLGSDQSASIGD